MTELTFTPEKWATISATEWSIKHAICAQNDIAILDSDRDRRAAELAARREAARLCVWSWSRAGITHKGAYIADQDLYNLVGIPSTEAEI